MHEIPIVPLFKRPCSDSRFHSAETPENPLFSHWAHEATVPDSEMLRRPGFGTPLLEIVLRSWAVRYAVEFFKGTT
jgi:hypothetical protein